MPAKSRITLPTKIFYGTGSIATGVKDTAFNVFLLFFYTQVVGLEGLLAGIAIFLALVVDAITDPLVGYWSDKVHTRWGRRHPFIYASALPMGIAFYFLFQPPFGADQTILFLWMAGFAIIVRIFMTFFAVPAAGLLAEMTSDYDERTSISGFRVLLGWLGGIAFATAGYLVFLAPSESFPDGRLNPAGYQDMALVGAIAISIAIVLCALGTHHMIPRLKEAFQLAGQSNGLKHDFSNLLQNRPFLILFAIIFVSATAIGFNEVMNLYMLSYFWGLTTEQLALITLAALVGTIIAFITIPWISKRHDKRPVGIVTVAIVMVTNPAIIGLRLIDILPQNGDPALLIILCLNAVISVFAAVGLTIIFTSMLADTIDRNELATGQRQEAIYSSALTFSLKATSGLGGLIAGAVLQLVSFPSGAEIGQVPSNTLTQLGAAVASMMLIFWLLALIILRLYPLSRKEHAQILTDIAAKRALSNI
ncbi:MAG: MFS transporter [Pseudomonadota bacterium]